MIADGFLVGAGSHRGGSHRGSPVAEMPDSQGRRSNDDPQLVAAAADQVLLDLEPPHQLTFPLSQAAGFRTLG